MGADKDRARFWLSDENFNSQIPNIEVINNSYQQPLVLAQRKWRSLALDIVHKLSRDALDINNANEILNDIAKAITSSFPITFAAIETYNQNELDLSIISRSEEAITSNTSLNLANVELSQTLAGETFKRQSTFIVNDGLNTDYIICPSNNVTTRVFHYLGVPLLIDGNIAGVLSLATTHNMVIDKEAIHWSETIAHHIAALLTREMIKKKIQGHEQVAANMLNALVSPTMTCSSDGLILNFNSAFRMMFEEFHGRTIDVNSTKTRKLFFPKKIENPFVNEFHLKLQKLFKDKIQTQKMDLLVKHTTFHKWYLATMSLMPDHETAVVMFVDISDRKQVQEQLEFEMLHDQGTGLANRILFQDRLNKALIYNKNEDTSTCVFILDIGRYSFIIESLGHAAADEIMSKVASRIESITHPSDLIARIGSSEFAILVQHIHDAQKAREFCLDLLAMFRVHFDIAGQEIKLHPSIGVAVNTPEKANDPDTLIHEAHAAMTQARDSSVLSYAFSTSSSTTLAYKKLETEKELTHAIDLGELKVFYQPQYSLHFGELIGLEALVRWDHPRRGLIPPSEFIDLAEECGLIEDVFKVVFSTVVNDTYELFQRGFSFKVWTNISAKQLTSRSTTHFISEKIKQCSVPASMIGFEITETAIMENSKTSERIIEDFSKLGVSIALDDFGTGYSSLSYLQKFDVDMIKIDKTFIKNIAVDASSAEIVSAIIAIAHKLKMSTLAEGVEDSSQIAILRELGCDKSQGYFYSKPVPFADLLTIIDDA